MNVLGRLLDNLTRLHAIVVALVFFAGMIASTLFYFAKQADLDAAVLQLEYVWEWSQQQHRNMELHRLEDIPRLEKRKRTAIEDEFLTTLLKSVDEGRAKLQKLADEHRRFGKRGISI